MIELSDNELRISFPDVHPDAHTSISFQRTLRIPDDDEVYPLPPGLGNFELRHIEDHAKTVPESWLKRGGIIFPMYQAEALWLNFDADYPFALKIGTGKINAVSGEIWAKGLRRQPGNPTHGHRSRYGTTQDYVVVPDQPWLDGYCVEKGIIRQFVAMPLGGGYTVEEQVSGNAEFGGIQIEAFPLKAEKWEAILRERRSEADRHYDRCECLCSPAMGLAPGGRMKQEIHEDPYSASDWDMEHSSRCWIHICNSSSWQAITNRMPPQLPVTAREYNNAGLPWFDHYSEKPAIGGSKTLAGTKSVSEFGKSIGNNPVAGDSSFNPGIIHTIDEEPPPF